MAFEPAEQLGSAMKGWVIDGCRFATSVWEWEDPLLGYSFIFWSLVGVYRWPSCWGGRLDATVLPDDDGCVGQLVLARIDMLKSPTR